MNMLKMPIRSLTNSLKYLHYKTGSYLNLIKAKKNAINHPLMCTHSLVLDIPGNYVSRPEPIGP